MPRLTNTNYYNRHKFLKYLWKNYQGLYAELEVQQQYELHSFYKPSRGLTKQELIEHRQSVSAENRSLPARASKAYIHLCQIYNWEITAKKEQDRLRALQIKTRSKKRGRITGVTVKPLLRPEIDWDKYARALLEYCRQRVKNEQQAEGGKIKMSDRLWTNEEKEERHAHALLMLEQIKKNTKNGRKPREGL